MATLTLQDASDVLWDAVVIGAGPAGALAAQQLATSGRRVLLVEGKGFPRPKVCGGCLNERTLALLDHCGLGSLAVDEGAVQLEAVEIRTGRSTLAFPLPGGVSLTRSVMDLRLVESAIRCGASFLDQTRARVSENTLADAREVELRATETVASVRARMVIAADGLARTSVAHLDELGIRTPSSPFVGVGAVVPAARWEGVASDLLQPGRLFMLVGDIGYLGITRAEQGQVSLAAAIRQSAIRDAGDVTALLSQVAESAGCGNLDLAGISWRGTPPLNTFARRQTSDRLFLIGDAAGYVEPFTGEGIAWALAGAVEVTPFVQRGIDGWTSDLGDEWQQHYRRHLRRSQWLCRGLAGLLHRPRASRWAARLAGQFPQIATWAISYLNRPVTAPSPGGKV